MNKYLKLFANHSAYSQAESNLDKPNVAVCLLEGDVHYNPDPYRGHEYVEIGGIKWATTNLGATSPCLLGLYFSYGDPVGYSATQVTGGDKTFSNGNNRFNKSNGEYDKYNSSDNKTALDSEDDPALNYWGGNWRTPSESDFLLLLASTNISMDPETDHCFCLTDKTDSSKKLYFPMSGNASGNNITTPGTYSNSGDAFILSSLVDNLYPERGTGLILNNLDEDGMTQTTMYFDKIDFNRNYGYNIRPVFKNPPIPVQGKVLVFKDSDCTQYATGMEETVYVRVNVDVPIDGLLIFNILKWPCNIWAYNSQYGDEAAVSLWTDWGNKNPMLRAITAGQIIECLTLPSSVYPTEQPDIVTIYE